MAEDVAAEAQGILDEYKDLGFPVLEIFIASASVGSDGLSYKLATPSEATHTTYAGIGSVGGPLSTIAVGDRDADLEIRFPGIDTSGVLIPPLPIETLVKVGDSHYLVTRIDGLRWGDNGDTAMQWEASATRRNHGPHARRGSRDAGRITSR